MFVKTDARSIPQFLVVLLKTPRGKSVNTIQLFFVSLLMGRVESGQQFKKHSVNRSRWLLELASQVWKKFDCLPTPGAHSLNPGIT
jgi:hypothetical protein